MAANYSGNPGDSTRDLVRFLITDTVTASPYFQDAELDYLIGVHTDGGVAQPYQAAIAAVQIIIGKTADDASETRKVGELSFTTGAGSAMTSWLTLQKELRKQAFDLDPGAPVINANAIVKTTQKINENAGSDFVLGQQDNKT